MAGSSTDDAGSSTDDNEEAVDYQALAEHGQRVVEAFWEHQAEAAAGDDFSIVNSEAMAKAFADVVQGFLSDPSKIAQAQSRFWQDNMALMQSFQARVQGESAEPVRQADPTDRRFKDKAWDDDPVSDYLKQAYLISTDWINAVIDSADAPAESKEHAAFYIRQFMSAMSPSNFAATNPAVIRAAKETGGRNLLQGYENLLADFEKGRGQLQISMTDENAFEVGSNIAVSPGKVVFQNDLMQLIQYAPTTETVHERPLLIVPPWINKFYVLDLQPRNSLIKWMVDQGYTVFLISWVNPNEQLAHKTFSDYMHEGPLAALDAIEAATGVKKINLLGFCIGGILTTATLAYMAATGDKRVKAAGLMATMIDLKDVGEISVFVNEDQLARIKAHVAKKGYLEGRHMADMFSMMRENDLIWSFFVNNYLMGKDPMPFDLLYWNSDSTRLPADMLVFYVENFYLQNRLIQPGGIELDGVPLDLGKIKVPLYAIATKEDHIAPWVSCYPLTQATGGSVRFVLGGSGHIAGIVNPPERGKYGYRTNTDYPADPEAWLAGAKDREGSWWPDWEKWLRKKAGPMVEARIPGEGGLEAIEDAPGSYVKVRNPD